MKFTLSWLRDHLNFDASVDAIVSKLNAIGFEVEEVIEPAKALLGFRVAKILEAHAHPNADRLKVCVVAAGTDYDRVQVVCGASNARAGLHVIFAPPGTVIPANGMTIKSGAIRGELSDGMLCSLAELGLAEESEGIAELDANAVIGTSYISYAELDDVVIDISITPNRGDVLNVRGIARELAAAGMGRIKPWMTPTVAGTFASPISWSIAYKEACPFVAGCLIRNVSNGPSPKWLANRLEMIGMKSISTLVDITNLILFDIGRPLHVFDAAALDGPTLTITRSAGETFLGLDGHEHLLGNDDVVIVDRKGVQSLAGILGGQNSGVQHATRDVFIESALFDPVRVALTGRRLNIATEARYRFERGVDPALVISGLERAVSLILELCGGQASEIVRAGAIPSWERDAWLRFDQIKAVGGVELSPEHSIRLLEHLGFTVLEREALRARFGVPSWRNDIVTPLHLDQSPSLEGKIDVGKLEQSVVTIEGERDLIEEVLRIHGYEAIVPQDLPSTEMGLIQTHEARRRVASRLARLCASRSFIENVGFSFVSRDEAQLFGEVPECLRLLNPIASDLDQMRLTPLINLVRVWQRHDARGLRETGFFEIGPGFLPGEQLAILAGLRGGELERHPFRPARALNPWDAKADLEAALEEAGLSLDNLTITRDTPCYYHPGRSGAVRLGPKTVVGYFGELHPTINRAFGIADPLVAFELFLNELPLPKGRRGDGVRLSGFQPVRRDFAFVVGEDVQAQVILRAIRLVNRKLITSVRLFDVYQGDQVAPGQRSLGFEVTLQPETSSLTDADLEAICQKISAAVLQATGAQLRG